MIDLVMAMVLMLVACLGVWLFGSLSWQCFKAVFGIETKADKEWYRRWRQNFFQRCVDSAMFEVEAENRLIERVARRVKTIEEGS